MISIETRHRINDMKDNFSLLKTKLAEFSSIPEESWQQFTSHLKIEKFKKGDHLVRAGDQAHTLYFVESGLARSYFIDQKGKEFIKAFFKNGDVAGPYAEMLLGESTLIFIEALEDLTVVALDFHILQKLYSQSLWFSEIGRKICEHYFITKEKRIFEFLHFSATERYERFVKENPDLINRLPQYQIAAFLGISPVSLSRLLKQK